MSLGRAVFAALSISLALSACEQPSAVAVDVEPAFARGRVVESVIGSWSVEGVRTFGFTARQHADGSVAGEWQRVNQNLDRTHNGTVLCLRIIGLQAWIGTLTKTGPQAGQEGGFRVFDAGEGANAPIPDLMSLHAVNLGPGGAAAFCAAAPNFPAFNLVGAGQVQVR